MEGGMLISLGGHNTQSSELWINIFLKLFVL